MMAMQGNPPLNWCIRVDGKHAFTRVQHTVLTIPLFSNRHLWRLPSTDHKTGARRSLILG